MYQIIRKHPNPFQLYQEKLINEGVLDKVSRGAGRKGAGPHSATQGKALLTHALPGRALTA
jgi:hypothetical protein